MPIPDIKPGGWGVEELLTSAQITDLKDYLTLAIDKTGDTIPSGSVIAVDGGLVFSAGSYAEFRETVNFETTSVTTFLAGSTLDLDCTVTGSGNMTLSGTMAFSGATTFSNTVAFGAAVSFGAFAVNFVNSAITQSGNFTFNGNLVAGATGALSLSAASSQFTIGVNCVASMTMGSSSNMTWGNGSSLTQFSGSTWTLQGSVDASNLTITSTNRVNLTPRSISRTASSTPYSSNVMLFAGAGSHTSDYLPCDSGGPMVDGGMRQIYVASATGLRYDLDLPNNGTLTAVSIRIDPANGHGALPTVPAFSVYKQNCTTGTITQIGATFTDTLTLGTGYENSHTLSVSGLSEVINRSQFVYWCVFRGESGASAIGGTTIANPIWTATVSEYTEH